MKKQPTLLEVSSDEIRSAWLKQNTKRSTFLCIHNPNVGMNCAFLSKHLGVEFTESDLVEIALVNYPTLIEAKKLAKKIKEITSHLYVEVWSKGKKIL